MSRHNLTRVSVLRIVRCSDPLLWYRHLVGQLVPHLGWDAIDGYKSREQAGYVNFVRAQDAEVTEVHVSPNDIPRWPFAYDPNTGRERRRVIHLTRRPRPAEQPACSAHACTEAQSTPQSIHLSAYEATANTVVGFLVSLCITAVIFPNLSLSHNVGITCIFAAASWLRSFLIRRIFNRYQAQP